MVQTCRQDLLNYAFVRVHDAPGSNMIWSRMTVSMMRLMLSIALREMLSFITTLFSYSVLSHFHKKH